MSRVVQILIETFILILKNIPESFWLGSPVGRQKDEGEETFAAGANVFWF
jgi:hypothetical protein